MFRKLQLPELFLIEPMLRKSESGNKCSVNCNDRNTFPIEPMFGTRVRQAINKVLGNRVRSNKRSGKARQAIDKHQQTAFPAILPLQASGQHFVTTRICFRSIKCSERVKRALHFRTSFCNYRNPFPVGQMFRKSESRNKCSISCNYRNPFPIEPMLRKSASGNKCSVSCNDQNPFPIKPMFQERVLGYRQSPRKPSPVTAANTANDESGGSSVSVECSCECSNGNSIERSYY